MDANSVKAGAGCLVAGMSQLILGGLGMVIHVITIIIAFKASGLLSAIISACVPVLAQIYWLYKIWSFSGVFFNWYTIMIIAYLGVWVLYFGGIFLFASSDT